MAIIPIGKYVVQAKSKTSVNFTSDRVLGFLRQPNLPRCTGWRAVHALANVYGDDVLVPSAVGRQFAF